MQPFPPKTTTCLALSILFLLFTSCATAPSSDTSAASSSELVEIPTRPGVTQKFVLLQPDHAVASIVLFSGGRGQIKAGQIFGKPTIGEEKSFLVFTRNLFVNQGFTVAVIDVPSDRANVYRGMWDAWRLDDRHVTDIRGVVSYLKERTQKPVFLAGQSMGSISVANAGIKLGAEVDGLVLASSITVSRTTEHWTIHKDYPNAILDLDLAQITLPVMIVAHEEDKCFVSPPTKAVLLKEALVNSPKVELQLYTGGKEPKESKGCTFYGAHSYFGLEDLVVSDICNFLKSVVDTP